jgi:hypothetical protein
MSLNSPAVLAGSTVFRHSWHPVNRGFEVDTVLRGVTGEPFLVHHDQVAPPWQEPQPWPAGRKISAATSGSTTSSRPTGPGARCAASRAARQGRRRAGPGQAQQVHRPGRRRELEAKARDLAGLKGYVTNLAACPDGNPVTPEFVISSYHELWNIPKAMHVRVERTGERATFPGHLDAVDANDRDVVDDFFGK